MNEQPKFEKREELNFDYMKVFRVRHGKSEYEELTGEISDSTIDITPEGVKQIEATTSYLESVLDKSKDVIVFGYSPRRRAIDSMRIIYNKLKESGFNVVDDSRKRELRNKLDSIRLLDKQGQVIEPGTNEYGDSFLEVRKESYEKYGNNWFQEVLAKNKDERIQNDTHSLESLAEVEERSLDHLSFLMRVSKKFQSKLATEGKRLVVIEIAHGEGIAEIIDRSTDGEKSISNNWGIENGGVVEMDIPVKGKTIKSKLWTESGGDEKLKPVNFDYLKRKFI